jgi:hypothetical protein
MRSTMRIGSLIGLLSGAIWVSAALAAPSVPAPLPTPVPSPVVREVSQAQPSGKGKLTWLGFEVYEAVLYTPNGKFEARGPMALTLTYLRDFKGQAIADRSRDEINKMNGLATPAQLTLWREAMVKIFPDVKKGQALTGVQRSDGATAFYLNEQLIGSIDDPAFSQAFFAIWLDPRTSAPALRKTLLGKAAGH